jgi:hypothetical protein
MPISKLLLDELLRLGNVASIDTATLSDTTLRSMVSHIRLLKRNGIPIKRETFISTDPLKILHGLKDMKDKPLQDQYKRQIAMTIKRLYPDLKFSLGELSKHPYQGSTRLTSVSFNHNIRKIVDFASEFVKTVTQQGDLRDLGTYDTCLSVLLTLVTSLRISEILDLQMTDLESIEKDKPIYIRTKGNRNVARRIVPNELLLMLILIIKSQRPKVEKFMNNSYNESTARNHIRKHRLIEQYVIISSSDFMRKKLREIAASLIDSSKNDFPIGFNVFRKYVTTMLVEKGGEKLAQAMNNHSSVNTTLDYYNVESKNVTEKTYDELVRLMDSLDRDENDDGDDDKRSGIDTTTSMKLPSKTRKIAMKRSTSSMSSARSISAPSPSPPQPTTIGKSIDKNPEYLPPTPMSDV